MIFEIFTLWFLIAVLVLMAGLQFLIWRIFNEALLNQREMVQIMREIRDAIDERPYEKRPLHER